MDQDQEKSFGMVSGPGVLRAHICDVWGLGRSKKGNVPFLEENWVAQKVFVEMPMKVPEMIKAT